MLGKKYPPKKPIGPYQISFYQEAYNKTLEDMQFTTPEVLYQTMAGLEKQIKDETFTTTLRGEHDAISDLIQHAEDGYDDNHKPEGVKS